MISLAQRVTAFRSDEFQKVFRKQQSIKHPIDLSVGVPEELTPEHIKAAGIRAIQRDKTVYTPANGIIELRQAIAEKLEAENNIHAPSESISVVPGLTTGLFLVYLALLDPGDQIIVIDPYYPPYVHLANAIGAQAITVPCLNTFQPDIAAIEKAITPKTKAIIVNSPNNPTGAVYSEATLKRIVAIAKERDIIIISDEIYEHFAPAGDHISTRILYDKTITMNGFSKAYAMTGWRLGYIHGPKDVIDAINNLQQYTVFSSSSIAQHAAVAALQHPRAISNPYDKKRMYVISRLRKMGLTVHGAAGGYYVFFQVPILDIDFVDQAAAHSLLLLPGRAFSARRDFVRLSYGASMKTLEKGLDILEKIMKTLV